MSSVDSVSADAFFASSTASEASTATASASSSPSASASTNTAGTADLPDWIKRAIEKPLPPSEEELDAQRRRTEALTYPDDAKSLCDRVVRVGRGFVAEEPVVEYTVHLRRQRVALWKEFTGGVYLGACEEELSARDEIVDAFLEGADAIARRAEFFLSKDDDADGDDSEVAVAAEKEDGDAEAELEREQEEAAPSTSPSAGAVVAVSADDVDLHHQTRYGGFDRALFDPLGAAVSSSSRSVSGYSSRQNIAQILAKKRAAVVAVAAPRPEQQLYTDKMRRDASESGLPAFGTAALAQHVIGTAAERHIVEAAARAIARNEAAAFEAIREQQPQDRAVAQGRANRAASERALVESLRKMKEGEALPVARNVSSDFAARGGAAVGTTPRLRVQSAGRARPGSAAGADSGSGRCYCVDDASRPVLPLPSVFQALTREL